MKRKQVEMLVRVSVPAAMTARQARREVRTLISDQCNYSADHGDVKAIACAPVSRDAGYRPARGRR